MGARGGEDFDISAIDRRYLGEAALRLLAALGSESRFPQDLGEIEVLAGRTGEGRPTEPMLFAVEPPGELPRYTGERQVWLSPAPEGCLRLRHEALGAQLRSEAVTLRPDGRLGEFETIEEFGVPESELTAQARADREAMARAVTAGKAEAADSEQRIDEGQRRFATEHLRAVVAAPPQPAGGAVISFVALYATGLIVYYLVPPPPDEELESDDPWAEPITAAMFPKAEISDEHGTSYEVAEWDSLDANAPLLRASQSFVPAVPGDAERLRVRIGSAEVEIEIGAR